MPAERQASYDDDDGDLSEEELLLTAPFVYGFSLEKKIWGKLSDWNAVESIIKPPILS